MWPFRRKTDEGVRAQAADEGVLAEAALEDAERSLKEIQKRHPEVRRVSTALRDFRERNHLSQQIDEIVALRRGRLG